MGRRVFYRAVWKGVVLQSILYSRLTHRINYVVKYKGGYGQIKYFLNVNDVKRYAVIIRLKYEDTLNVLVGEKTMKLDHIAKCQRSM